MVGIFFPPLSLSILALSLIQAGVRSQTTLIPTTCFDAQSDFEGFFDYNYPWDSDTHNGGARMDASQCSISDGSLVQTAIYDPEQPDVDDLAINYLSCTVFARQTFTVEAGGGLDFSAEFIAPTELGTWPAFWLTGTEGWPPEIDMAEWKGSGKISFNTFNTSSEVSAVDIDYPDEDQWHSVLVELRDEQNGSGDVAIKFYMDGNLQSTQYAAGYVGAGLWLIIDYQMEGSSGSPGPQGDTSFSTRNLEVLTYNA